MYEEPPAKRAVAFVDGANTRLCARKAFGDGLMNINPLALVQAMCAHEGFELAGAYYYLGVPDVRVTEDGHYAWMKRCARWRRQGVRVFTRTLLHDETGAAREKGIDVRLALDAVDLYRREPFDVAMLFSQDQDFSELASELKTLAREQGRWIEIVSVFPWADGNAPSQGIVGTRPILIDKETLRGALDTAENRALRFKSPQTAEPAPPSATATVVPAFLPPEAEKEEARTEPPREIKIRSAPALPAPVPVAYKPRHSVWLSAASAIYLAAAVATFVLLEIKTVGVPARVAAPLEERLTQTTQDVAQAALWPLYWSQHNNLDRLASEAAQRASSIELPHWHFGPQD